jgi:hypothetical protein
MQNQPIVVVGRHDESMRKWSVCVEEGGGEEVVKKEKV